MKSQDGSKIVQQLYAGVLTVACITTFPLAGQSAADDRLAAARAAIRAMNFDSAASLLRHTLESTGRPSHDERLEAWLLLGVVQFYQGDDSGTAADFRQALELEPRLQAQGLAKYDSALVVLFEAQRVRSEEHTSELQSQSNLVCRLLLEKKKKTPIEYHLLSSCTRDALVPSETDT